MPFTLTMPKLSPTMEEGTIAKWRVKEGDFIKADEVIIEVATDKATVEYSALDKGYLRKILIPEGKEALVNQAIAIFTEKADESIEGYEPEGIKPQAATKVEPQISASKTTTGNISIATKAEASSIVQPSFQPEPPLANFDFSVFKDSNDEKIYASPFAKKLAKEKGIDITSVKGSGPHGRIMSRDLDKGQPEAIVGFGKKEIPKELPGSYEEIKLTPMRKVIGQRLQESKTFIPHFYVTQEFDVEPLIAIREQLKNYGIKISVNDFIVRASALALREHPKINSGFNTLNSTITQYKTIDISIAVSMEAGLITPIVRHADFKNIGQLSSEIKSLAFRAKEGKLAREEYVGGSFTISNLGMFGVSNFSGVINPPQAAILCVAGIQEKPVVKNATVVPGKTIALTLCSDHRVIDGTDAAKFLNTLKKLLENPSVLIVS